MTSQPLGPTAPTIGRIVHIATPMFPVPAIVTAVLSSDHRIAATAFAPGADPQPIEAEHAEPGPDGSAPAGTWHWPPLR